MSVCLSARIYQNHTSKFHEIFYTRYLRLWFGPPLTTAQYVMYFRFCGWRHVFTQWGQWAKIKHDVVSSSSPDNGTSRTSDNVKFGRVRQTTAPGAKLLFTTVGVFKLRFTLSIWDWNLARCLPCTWVLYYNDYQFVCESNNSFRISSSYTNILKSWKCEQM